MQVLDWSGGKRYLQRLHHFHKMSEPRISTAMCHLLLAGSTAWTCRTLHNAGQIQWAYGTLGLYFAKSVIGVLRFGSQFGHKISSLYNFVELCSIAVGVPFIASDLFSLLHYDRNHCTLHVFLGVILSIGVIIGNHHSILSYLSFILLASIFSTLTIGLLSENYWAVASGLSYSMNLYGVKHCGTIGRVPSLDLYTIGLCFFNFFIYKAFTDFSVFG